MMTLAEYQQLSGRTEKELDFSGRLHHGLIGLIGEIAELQAAMHAGDINEMQEEMGDCYWYLALLARACQFNLSEVGYVPCPAEPDEAYLQGLLCHCGLLADAIKRATIYNKPYEAQRGAMREQVLLCVRWLQAAARVEGFDNELILFENIAKLRKRYPEAYSDAAALQRADKAAS